VNSHACTFFGSYPFGFRTLVRKVALGSKTDEQTADSLISLWSHKSLDESRQRASLSVLEDVSNGWVGELRKLLAQACEGSSLPHEVLISARMHEEFFIAAFADAYSQTIVEPLEKQQLAQDVSFAPSAEQRRSTSLYVGAIRSIQGE
jgi:hypothetical protein